MSSGESELRESKRYPDSISWSYTQNLTNWVKVISGESELREFGDGAMKEGEFRGGDFRESESLRDLILKTGFIH